MHHCHGIYAVAYSKHDWVTIVGLHPLSSNWVNVIHRQTLIFPLPNSRMLSLAIQWVSDVQHRNELLNIT